MCDVIVLCVLAHAQEREVRAKFMQLMSGLPAVIYWLGTFVCDLVSFLFPCAVIMLLFLVFDINEFISGSNAGYVCDVITSRAPTPGTSVTS